MDKPIARLPNPNNPDDEHCSICSDDNIVAVVKGETNCGYCGNQINLCSKHYFQVQRELKSINEN